MYDQFVVRTIPVSSLETAEAAKLTENIFRAVNVALVNELKVVYSAMGVDIFEVIEAADKAIWLYAVLSRTGPRRTLHTD